MNVLVRCALLSVSLSLVATAKSAFASPTLKPFPMCDANQLSLATDAENGSFNGMSHSGTLLVLRNLGPSTCRIEAFPEVTFNDAKGPLKITFTVPGRKFMHPGPVMVPAVVAPGAEVTSTLRWVSSPVYDPGVCFQVTTVTVQVGSAKQTSPLSASICGASALSVSVENTRFLTDPVAKP